MKNIIISSENNSSFINFKVKSRIELRRPRKKRRRKRNLAIVYFKYKTQTSSITSENMSSAYGKSVRAYGKRMDSLRKPKFNE